MVHYGHGFEYLAGPLEDLIGYTLEEEFARGGFGEIWRAAHKAAPSEDTGPDQESLLHQEQFILKRISLHKGSEVRSFRRTRVYLVA